MPQSPKLFTCPKCRETYLGTEPLPDCPHCGYDYREKEGFRWDVVVYLLVPPADEELAATTAPTLKAVPPSPEDTAAAAVPMTRAIAPERTQIYTGTRIPSPIPTVLEVPRGLHETEDILEVNFGPNHPSTHGVLRLVIDLNGETVVGLRAVIGYLHTGPPAT